MKRLLIRTGSIGRSIRAAVWLCRGSLYDRVWWRSWTVRVVVPLRLAGPYEIISNTVDYRSCGAASVSRLRKKLRTDGRSDKSSSAKLGISRLNFSIGQHVRGFLVSAVYDRTKQDEDGDNIRYFWCCYRPVYCFATKVRPMSSYSKSWSKSPNRTGVRIGL